MTITCMHRNSRSYYYGTIFPLGHEHAVDAAQARTFERELAAMSAAETEQENAA